MRLQGVCLSAVPTGIEPAISALTGRHVSHYTTGPERPEVYHRPVSKSSNFWAEGFRVKSDDNVIERGSVRSDRINFPEGI